MSFDTVNESGGEHAEFLRLMNELPDGLDHPGQRNMDMREEALGRETAAVRSEFESVELEMRTLIARPYERFNGAEKVVLRARWNKTETFSSNVLQTLINIDGKIKAGQHEEAKAELDEVLTLTNEFLAGSKKDLNRGLLMKSLGGTSEAGGKTLEKIKVFLPKATKRLHHAIGTLDDMLIRSSNS